MQKVSVNIVSLCTDRFYVIVVASWQMMELKIPAFGVCLGLQGMVEHFGGKLSVLSYPMHGKVLTAPPIALHGQIRSTPPQCQIRSDGLG